MPSCQEITVLCNCCAYVLYIKKKHEVLPAPDLLLEAATDITHSNPMTQQFIVNRYQT